ncbi:unnamed protein product [Polarella glacialis]|uniref:non-specific serine/threonine protein kinase n=1 Tax=Polarella glacialis TaxID=89957 RepID=A0A813F3I3_POLGL|nr:unnamed protein product [Polarella glacialis]
MEFADAGDLSGAISRLRTSGRKYHEREAMAVFAQLALALEFVHSKRILHRDLKSQNVFLTSAGVVKLGDFGIARVLQDCERCVETRIGTPHNMPPEMIEGRPYDFKADIWGLGVLLYEVLALTVPFSAASVAGLVVRICTTEPKPIPAMYSSELRALVSHMLSKQAADRPSASEIASLAHVRRGLAAMRPCTPAVASAGAPAPPPPPPATSFHAGPWVLRCFAQEGEARTPNPSASCTLLSPPWGVVEPGHAEYGADALRILRSALGECSPMSALLSELEQGWQPTPKGELSGVQMMTSRPSFGQ